MPHAEARKAVLMLMPEIAERLDAHLRAHACGNAALVSRHIYVRYVSGGSGSLRKAMALDYLRLLDLGFTGTHHRMLADRA